MSVQYEALGPRGSLAIGETSLGEMSGSVRNLCCDITFAYNE